MDLIEHFSLYEFSENLTNDAEAVLEARLLKCKRPADDSSDGRQRQQREADDRWNGTDGHVRSAVIHHHIRVEIITGKIHRHRWVSHNHPAAHFTVHPLRNTCVRSSHIIMTVAFLRIQILHWTQHSTNTVYCVKVTKISFTRSQTWNLLILP